MPIFRVSTKFQGGKRIQFPIVPAAACTVHKSQGLSFDEVFVDMGKNEYTPGLSFVALSRCRKLQNLYLKPFSLERFKLVGDVTDTLIERYFELKRLADCEGVVF